MSLDRWRLVTVIIGSIQGNAFSFFWFFLHHFPLQEKEVTVSLQCQFGCDYSFVITNYKGNEFFNQQSLSSKRDFICAFLADCDQSSQSLADKFDLQGVQKSAGI